MQNRPVSQIRFQRDRNSFEKGWGPPDVPGPALKGRRKMNTESSVDVRSSSPVVTRVRTVTHGIHCVRDSPSSVSPGRNRDISISESLRFVHGRKKIILCICQIAM
ncbi:hypothetical protein CDAR_568471 [Caerostris darwini]|uniref:Uncharacterized protein n=1 Tax=Caerostris darwini TaxID=1538125 RepID=A0AAV4TWA0_9ARAC|nr:hypothetical protein CDAR_568471 [Caerostris darwini]